MKKAIVLLAAVLCILCTSVSAEENIPEWAAEAVGYCTDSGIISGYTDGSMQLGNSVTKAEMAKMLVNALDLDAGTATLSGITSEHWAYEYACALYAAVGMDNVYFAPSAKVTREEFAAVLVLAVSLTESDLENSAAILKKYPDYADTNKTYAALFGIAVERGWINGIDGKLLPADTLTRQQACVMIYNALINTGLDKTYILGEPEVTVEQAKAWAQSVGAADIYVDIADTYWKYGEITGIRADVLYAQAGLETGYGKYGNRVTADMNNWAGIKKYGHNGDATEDHESFATPDDGVRAHFNHMAAYVGVDPVGEPHGRYYSVLTLSWAGMVKFVEDLGGKWCPDTEYGKKILKNCIEPMKNF